MGKIWSQKALAFCDAELLFHPDNRLNNRFNPLPLIFTKLSIGKPYAHSPKHNGVYDDNADGKGDDYSAQRQ
jgi:hypothetical protein